MSGWTPSRTIVILHKIPTSNLILISHTKNRIRLLGYLTRKFFPFVSGTFREVRSYRWRTKEPISMTPGSNNGNSIGTDMGGVSTVLRGTRRFRNPWVVPLQVFQILWSGGRGLPPFICLLSLEEV